MTPCKRKVSRIALYLSSIGTLLVASGSSYRQLLAGLQHQYNGLSIEQRKLARLTGRRLIKTMGSVNAALTSLPIKIALQEQNVRSTLVASPTKDKRREEIFAIISRRWSALTPPCPSCRMGNGYPKRSWPTREWADEVHARQHDRETLSVYACPVQPGFWHLGHVGRRTATSSKPKIICLPTVPPSQLPDTSIETGGHVRLCANRFSECIRTPACFESTFITIIRG